MAKKLGRVRTTAVILAVFFYVVAKVACYWTPDASHMTNVAAPVIYSIICNIRYACMYDDTLRSVRLALLALQASMLGLAILSSVTAYAIHILCKITERNGLSG